MCKNYNTLRFPQLFIYKKKKKGKGEKKKAKKSKEKRKTDFYGYYIKTKFT